MDIVAKSCLFLMLCGLGHSIDLKPDLYTHGDNAIVHIDQLGMTGSKILEITFAGFASKLHVTNVMLYDTTKKHHSYISININYNGRIKDVKRSHNSLSFLLQNVTFMDSGNYTIFEGSIEKGKTGILVARYRLTGQDKEQMVLPFMYNKMNISTIQIEMHISSINFHVLIYDVQKENCTNFGQLYIDRIENCVLRGNLFSFTFREVSWLDKGMYSAWDDKGFILDTIMVDFKDLSESFSNNIEEKVPLKQTVASTGSSTSYTIPPPSSSDKCQFKADIGLDGAFEQMFKVEVERLNIERERLRAEIERMKVEKQRLAIETERLGLEKDRTEILKSKSTE